MVPEALDIDIAVSKGLTLKRDAHTDEFASLQDIIGSTKSVLKNRAITLDSIPKLCGSCHESCIRCNGPLDSNCIMCDSDYNQIIIGSNMSCVRKSNNTTGTLVENIKSDSKLQIVLISVMIGFLLLITSVFIYLLCRKHDINNASKAERDKFSGKYVYGRIVHETEEIPLTMLPDNPSNDEDSDASET